MLRWLRASRAFAASDSARRQTEQHLSRHDERGGLEDTHDESRAQAPWDPGAPPPDRNYVAHAEALTLRERPSLSSADALYPPFVAG